MVFWWRVGGWWNLITWTRCESSHSHFLRCRWSVGAVLLLVQQGPLLHSYWFMLDGAAANLRFCFDKRNTATNIKGLQWNQSIWYKFENYFGHTALSSEFLNYTLNTEFVACYWRKYIQSPQSPFEGWNNFKTKILHHYLSVQNLINLTSKCLNFGQGLRTLATLIP